MKFVRLVIAIVFVFGVSDLTADAATELDPCSLLTPTEVDRVVGNVQSQRRAQQLGIPCCKWTGPMNVALPALTPTLTVGASPVSEREFRQEVPLSSSPIRLVDRYGAPSYMLGDGWLFLWHKGFEVSVILNGVAPPPKVWAVLVREALSRV